MFFVVIGFIVLNVNLFNANSDSLKYFSAKNKKFKVRSAIINICSVNAVNKCSGGCNKINDPYSKLCIPDVTKNINIKLLNLMSINNEQGIYLGMRLGHVNVD